MLSPEGTLGQANCVRLHSDAVRQKNLSIDATNSRLEHTGMNRIHLLISAASLLCVPMPGFASSVSLCDAVTGNIVANCGFEGGTYSSDIGGNTNSSVPNLWTPSAGFDLEPGFNHTTTLAYSGTYGLSIGNYDGQPIPSLSQTLTDIVGATYSGSLYVDYGGAGTSDTSVFFDTLIDDTPVVTLDNTAPGPYTQYTFSFVGTGSDVLTIEGNTSPSEWYVDDIVVTESAGPVVPGAAPEPASFFLLAGAAGAFCLVLRRRSVTQ